MGRSHVSGLAAAGECGQQRKQQLPPVQGARAGAKHGILCREQQGCAGAGHDPLWFLSPRQSEGAGCRGGTGCSALHPTALPQGQSGVCSTMSLMISVQSCPGIHSASAFLTSVSAAWQIPITRIRCRWLVDHCWVEKASVFLHPDHTDGERAGGSWCDTGMGSTVTLQGNRRGLGGEGWGRGKQPRAALPDHQSHPPPFPRQMRPPSSTVTGGPFI